MQTLEIERPTAVRGKSLVRKNLALLSFGRFISASGDCICYFSLMWFILKTGGSATQVSLLVTCHILPSVFFAPFAGVLADRFDRKIVMIISDGLCALIIATLAVMYRLDWLVPGVVFAGVGLLALAASMHHPASSALLPNLVPPEALARANSLEVSVAHFAKIAGVTAAGFAYDRLGLQGILLAAAGAFLVSAFSQAFLVEVKRHREAFAPSGILGLSAAKAVQEMAAAHRYLFAQKKLYGLVWFLAVLGLLTVPTVEVVFPYIFENVFQSSLSQLSYAQGALSLGFAFGSLICSKASAPARLSERVAVNILLASLTLALFCVPIWPGTGLFTNVDQKLGAFYGLAFVAGTFTAMGLIPANVLFQTWVRKDMMGRVFGLIGSFSNAAIGVGLLLVGGLTDRMPVHTLLLAIAATLITISIWMRFAGVLRKGESYGG